MKGFLVVIFVLCTFFTRDGHSSDMIECNIEEIKQRLGIASIEFKSEPEKTNVSFLVDELYWSATLFELSFEDNSRLLKGVSEISPTSFDTIHKNFIGIIENEMFSLVRQKDIFEFPQSNGGKAIVFRAQVDKLVSKDAVDDLWGIGSTVKQGKLLVMYIHILGAGDNVTLESAKGFMTELYQTCLSDS